MTSSTQVRTISLIGMPGAGKSTVGVLLAKLCGLAFRDTDLDIQIHVGATLQDILEREGYLRLRAIEQDILQRIPLQDSVISTGGSAVYSAPAMDRLASAGPLVYLRTSFDTLQQRVSAAPSRGIASHPGQDFADIHAERTPLYEKYADITIDTDGYSAGQLAQRIARDTGFD